MNRIYLVGIGPGSLAHMSGAAVNAMQDADILCGYSVYLDLVRDLFPEKEYFSTAMTHELERCRKAFEFAASGKTVAMLCSGDAGIYGMSGPVLQMASEYPETEFEIIPGITAAISGAAVLGAPLMLDFCVISLSDLLAPWEQIEKRLRAAAQADFAVCLYNPRSRKRSGHLKHACEILMEEKSPSTVCGWVKNIGRSGQQSRLMTLAELSEDTDVDMFTTVFIGCAGTQIVQGKMITPRGYKLEI